MDELKKHIQNYLDYLKAKNYAARTLENRFFEMNFFMNWLKKKNIYALSGIKSSVILNYQAYLSRARSELTKKNYMPSTQMKKLSDIKEFFKYLVITDVLLTNPARNIIMPKDQKIIKWELLSLYNIKKILLTIDLSNPLFYRDRAIIEILYTTGMRASELCNLKIADIDYQNNYIRINSGKGNIDRVTPVCVRALEFTRNYIENFRKEYVCPQSGEYLFLSWRGKKMDKGALGQMIKLHTRKALIEKKITPHCFRVTSATHMLKNGADVRYIQQMLGHKKIDTTMQYLKLEKSELKRVHTAAHPREKREKQRKNEEI